MRYSKILVPVDRSKPSETALEHAITIAQMSIHGSNQTVEFQNLYSEVLLKTYLKKLNV